MDELDVLAEGFAAWDLLKPQDKELFESSSYQDVQQDINALQSHQERTKTMMNMKRIHPFLTAMVHLEKVLTAIKFQNPASIMAYVWGPVRFLLKLHGLKITSSDERAFDNVLDIYERLGHGLPLLYEYVRLFTTLPESEGCLVYIYQDVLTFHRHAYKLFSLWAKLWQRLSKATWKSLKHTFDHLADSLQSHGRLIQTHRSSLRNHQPHLDHNDEPGLGVTQDWSDAQMEFYRYRNDVKRRRDRFEDEETKRKEDDKQSVVAWISASKKTQSLHTKFRDTRICRNTCRWLLRRYSEVTDWMKEDLPPESTIWLHGSKGYGKTVLASFLIDELNELCTERKKFAIPRGSKTYYFYCQEEDPEHCTYLDILKGILHQMVDAEDYLLPLCVEKAASGAITNLTNAETAQSLIEAFFEYNSRQYVIIDGLDECGTDDIRQAANFFMGQATKCDNEIRQGRLPDLDVTNRKCKPSFQRRELDG